MEEKSLLCVGFHSNTGVRQTFTFILLPSRCCRRWLRSAAFSSPRAPQLSLGGCLSLGQPGVRSQLALLCQRSAKAASWGRWLEGVSHFTNVSEVVEPMRLVPKCMPMF